MPAVQAREGTKPCGVRGPKLNRVKSVEEREKDAGAWTQPRRNGGRKNPVPGVVSPDSSLLSASLLARVTAQTVTFRSLSLPAQHGAKAPAGGGGGRPRLSTDRRAPGHGLSTPVSSPSTRCCPFTGEARPPSEGVFPGNGGARTKGSTGEWL